MIRITRNLMVGGCLRLAISVGALSFAALPAWADYQSGVDAYYKGDFQAAYDAWLPLAEAGDAVAQNSLGALFDHGLGVTEDNAEAARWYEMAAQQGLPLAMRNLGNQYATGHGVPFDLDLARQWYEKAAALGDQQSAALLDHLRPATTPPSDSAAATTLPAFSAPSTTGVLAQPVDNATPAASSTASSSDGDLTIPDAPAAEPVPAPASDAPIALDLGGSTVTMPAEDQVPAQPVASAQPAAVPVQQAAVTPMQPAAPRADGNWLIGQWQGPSLGCPKGGGVEFTDSETLSWFDGQIAVRLASTYRISGDNIVVTATGSDGAPQQYTYQRSGADKMIIVSIPQSMPKSLLGIAYRRCGPAPSVTQSAAAGASPVPAGTPVIGSTAPAAAGTPASSPAVETSTAASSPAPTAPATAAQPTIAAGEAPQYTLNEQSNFARAVAANDDKAAEGWRAFEQGQYQEALAAFKSLADSGNTNMQVLVGSMYDYGQGVPQDDVQALQWYLMAAASGNAKGQYQAANLYFNSPSVPQDMIEAYRWGSLAAKGPAGQPVTIWAQQLISTLTANMSQDDIDDAKSLAKKSLKTE
ncbi:tetratricopeptide repeat protein [Dongia sp.]|uniref:tetratricopeptide repeat protein n=1 Tax=Dongia sp. TaxID=1977262 RepID=UPI0035B3F0A2